MVTTPGPYELVLTPPAHGPVANQPPEPVAAAVIEFLTTPLVANPHRVAKQLRDDLAGVWSTRRGTYRVLYRINVESREVVVRRVGHRRDAYRPL